VSNFSTLTKVTAGDFLAGGGGVTEAMNQVPGLDVKWVLNHDNIAIRTNLFHHKNVKHYWADLYKQDEHEMEPVDFVWASIECTQHSQANGGRDKKIGSYMLGWELVRYMKYLQPLIIGIENVPEFKKWAPLDAAGKPDKKRQGEEFRKWVKTICALGYDYDERVINAADYGIPTRRVRYFAFFVNKSLNMQIPWPEPTHNLDGSNGLKKWVACKQYINLSDEGNSIFGRAYNPNVHKGKRHPLSVNTLKRIAGGIKKLAPELHFILQYYGNGINGQTVEKPLNTVRTKDCHVLVTIEKKQFVQDHCHTDNFHEPNEPLNPVLTRQTKQLITTKAQFISPQYNSNGNPGANTNNINEPLNSITTEEKFQFITAYFNSSGNPESQNQSLNNPLGTILTGPTKKALVTAMQNGEIDFDIKMRFLHPEELSRISTFPENYFTNPHLRLTKKEQVKLIGNAVPPEWARQIIAPVIERLQEVLIQKQAI
jgi:DNA (cytosine-5)-methyltransferase 1